MTPTGFPDIDTHIGDRDLAVANAFLFMLKSSRCRNEETALTADYWIAELRKAGFKQVDLRGAKLRAIVGYLRRQADPECSRIGSSRRGYWWAERRADLGPTEDHLEERSRLMDSARRGLIRSYGDNPDQARLRL